MSKIIGISTSFNKNSKSRMVLEELKSNLKDEYEHLDIMNDFDTEIFCEGCENCKPSGICVKASNRKLIETVISSASIIFAFPIYYGSISGKSKSLLESFFCLMNKELKGKKVIVILSSEKDNQEGIAVLELLPWAFKHEVDLSLIEIVHNGLTDSEKEHLLARIVNELNNNDQKEIKIKFENFTYLDKVVEIPIKFSR